MEQNEFREVKSKPLLILLIGLVIGTLIGMAFAKVQSVKSKAAFGDTTSNAYFNKYM